MKKASRKKKNKSEKKKYFVIKDKTRVCEVAVEERISIAKMDITIWVPMCI